MFNKLESGLGKYAEEKLIFQIKLYTPSAWCSTDIISWVNS
jgi:hypothetical protein